MKTSLKIQVLFLLLITSSFSYAQVEASDFTDIESKVIQWRHEIHQNPEFFFRLFIQACDLLNRVWD